MAQINQLSNREREVVELLLQGKSNKLIASALSISDRTVEFHLKNIYTKLQVSSRMELVLKLGNATGRLEEEKPGISTVADQREVVEDRDRLNLWNWAASLREAVSLINKDQKMENFWKSSTPKAGSPLTFFESIRVCLTKYAEFKGRASRAEFWWFTLFVILVASALMYFSETLGGVFLNCCTATPIGSGSTPTSR